MAVIDLRERRGVAWTSSAPALLACFGMAGLLGIAGCDRAASAPSEAYLRARSRAAPAQREWRTYLGDTSSQQYSALEQITRDNVTQLQVAWTYDAGGAAGDGTSQIQCNPIVVDGVLYGTSPDLQLFALDAATGEELWRFRPDEGGERAGLNPNRGVTHWADGDDERVLYTAGPHLIAIDARTGEPIEGFGDGGRVDLRAGLDDTRAGGFVIATTPGTIYDDLLLLGSRVSELGDAAPGHVRAFDVRTGEVRWVFRTIPRPGEFGFETWPTDAWKRIGGANSWAGISIDAERGLAFVPTGSASFDFYGADRLGDDLFANSLVALDANTGERRWHFQMVHHDVWDRDLPAPPNLVRLERDGKPVDAVAQVTKTGHVFVFERETGVPLFPIEEVPVPTDGLPGEVLSPTQPLPTRPPPFVRPLDSGDPLTHRTPEAHAAALARFRSLRTDHLYAPPSEQGTLLFPSFDGGAEWGGAAFDAASGLLYVNANEVASVLEMVPTPEIDSASAVGRAAYLMACAPCHGVDRRGDGTTVPSLVGLGERLGPLEAYRIVRDGRGRMPGQAMLRSYEIASVLWYLFMAGEQEVQAPSGDRHGDELQLGLFGRYINAGYGGFQDADGFPATRPPWGTLSAIDLNRGEIAWRIPLGDIPELAAQGVHGLGAQSYGGPVVTGGGLVFIAATPDEKMRAFDKASGDLLWEAPLPAAGFATPSTYEVEGRQYVVVAAGGGKLGRPSGSRYVAFALPAE